MSQFLSNASIALTLFKIDNPTALQGDKLKKYAFRPIDSGTDTKAWGWTSIEDMLDTDWQSPPEKGQFLCFALRVDTRKVPKPVLQKYLAEALREEAEKNSADGKNYVSRARKKELKEQQTARLLAKTEPLPTTVDVVCDSQSGLLYVATTSTAYLDLITELMKQTFGVEPQPLLPDLELVPDKMQELYAASRDIPYEDHSYTLAEAGQLTLASAGGEEGEVTVKNEPGSAQSGIDAGLTIRKLKCSMERVGEADLVWQFTLHPDLSFSGLKTPKVDKQSGDDPDAVLLAKLYLVDQAVGVVHTLFDVR